MPMTLIQKAITLITAALSLVACSSEPTREVKPLSARPEPPVDTKNLRTAEEKIAYIESSNAPEMEKKAAIEKIRAGKL